MRSEPTPSARLTPRPIEGIPPYVSTVRQLGLRGSTDFPVVLHNANLAAHCRAIDVSSTGIVLDRGREVSPSDQVGVFRLELYIPEAQTAVRVLARSVRHCGSQQALRFVAISDADRLTLSEHLDRQWLRGAVLH